MTSEEATIERESVIVAGRGQVSADLGAGLSGQAVILHLNDGVYYELNEVGAHIWKLIQEPRSVAAVLESILSAYEVSAERCEADLLALLRELLARDLIEIRNG